MFDQGNVASTMRLVSAVSVDSRHALQVVAHSHAGSACNEGGVPGPYGPHARSQSLDLRQRRKLPREHGRVGRLEDSYRHALARSGALLRYLTSTSSLELGCRSLVHRLQVRKGVGRQVGRIALNELTSYSSVASLYNLM